MGKLKILFVANRKDIFSGGQLSLIELISGLDKTRYEPVLLTPGVGTLSKKMHLGNVKVEVLDMPSVKTLKFKKIREKVNEFNYLIKKHDFDIIHTNGSRAQFYAALAVKGTRAKLVWHVRESVKDFYLYDRFLADRSCKIICVSSAVKKRRFSRFLGIDKKIVTIYNGVDTEKFIKNEAFRKEIRGKFNIDKNETLVGIIGVIVPLKGHLVLFRAIKDVLNSCPNLKLLVAGEAINERYLKKLERVASEFKLEKNIIFTGPVNNIREILSALDVFVLPSKREGFSRALLEAMSTSAAIIASDVDGNNEAIIDKKCGLLIPFGNQLLLAEAIKTYTKDPEYGKMLGKNARERVIEKFSIRKHVEAVQALYEELRSIN